MALNWLDQLGIRDCWSTKDLRVTINTGLPHADPAFLVLNHAKSKGCRFCIKHTVFFQCRQSFTVVGGGTRLCPDNRLIQQQQASRNCPHCCVSGRHSAACRAQLSAFQLRFAKSILPCLPHGPTGAMRSQSLLGS